MPVTYGSGSRSPVATTILATGSYVIPPGATQLAVTLWGAGGGGGSGRRGLIASARSGGLGGWGSYPVTYTFPVSTLTSPVTITIGAGGTGGAAVAVDSTSGNPGTDGTATTFGSYLKALGGYGGLGGTALPTNAQAGSVQLQGGGLQLPSTSSTTTDLAITNGNPGVPIGASAGGTGGSISTTNVELGGVQAAFSGWADPALAAPTLSAVRTNGASGANSAMLGIAGYGGTGGGANSTGTGAGGNGGLGGRGSGGGGGGASTNGANSGAGGNGGGGMAYIVAYFS